MKYKVTITKIWEGEQGANSENMEEITGVMFNVMGIEGTHSIFASGHNLKPNQIKKAIKDHLKTLPPKPELEGTTIDVDTEEED